MVTTSAPVPGVFLDRDGVLAIPEFRDGRSYAPRRFEEFRLYPDAEESVRRLKTAGFAVVVVTNQPDVGNGKVEQSAVEQMHTVLRHSVAVDRIEVCYHGQAAACTCRKPRPGMLLTAAAALGIDLSRSFMVGDRASDVEAGSAAGCTTVFVDLDYVEEAPPAPDFVVRSLAEAVDVIIAASSR
jgi:D-glycero-D-manno-heptose 1,7-bisphosphate phosphatase